MALQECSCKVEGKIGGIHHSQRPLQPFRHYPLFCSLITITPIIAPLLAQFLINKRERGNKKGEALWFRASECLWNVIRNVQVTRWLPLKWFWLMQERREHRVSRWVAERGTKAHLILLVFSAIHSCSHISFFFINGLVDLRWFCKTNFNSMMKFLLC